MSKSHFFCFLGVKQDYSENDLLRLAESLKDSLQEMTLIKSFVIRGKLLTIAVEDFNFYVSLLADRYALNDFSEMAANFQVYWNRKPIDAQDLIKAYKIFSDKDLYPAIYLEIGSIIMNEMEKIKGVVVYSSEVKRKSFN